MTPKEKQVVEHHIKMLFREMHNCALTAPLHPKDAARGLKVGQLCDDCVAGIKWHMDNIEKEAA